MQRRRLDSDVDASVVAIAMTAMRFYFSKRVARTLLASAPRKWLALAPTREGETTMPTRLRVTGTADGMPREEEGAGRRSDSC